MSAPVMLMLVAIFWLALVAGVLLAARKAKCPDCTDNYIGNRNGRPFCGKCEIYCDTGTRR